ncbi:MAG: c-type cytochrome [Caulobacteraceae bacterium]|nr:c-type cytochrome [Caulobacteraceae bacterium]
MRRPRVPGALPLTVLGLAGAAVAQAPGGDLGRGAALFEDRCAMCHLAGGGGQGPSLKGVYARKAGAAPGFHYSAALAGSGLTWTAVELDRFLAGPAKAVPGTAMAVAVSDPARRRDLIAYLRAASR